MNSIEKILDTIKWAVIVIIAGAGVWLYKDYEFQKAENTRQTENNRQFRMADSLKYTKQVLTLTELKDYTLYQNKDLQKKLAQAGIDYKKIENIIATKYSYVDNSKKEIDVSNMVAAIQKNEPKTQIWKDSSKCLTIDGKIDFDGKNLKVVVDHRELHNTSYAVGYWERKQWKWWFIKSRLLGKRQITATVMDDCGTSKVLEIKMKDKE